MRVNDVTVMSNAGARARIVRISTTFTGCERSSSLIGAAFAFDVDAPGALDPVEGRVEQGVDPRPRPLPASGSERERLPPSGK
jgi:hypothetical protein